jgi:diguanylate cyclase (GGDEF)-like protein/PAS domain S-box-containing protein
MTQPMPGQQKIFYLIAVGFLFVFVLSIGFSSAIVYSMARQQPNAQNVYIRSLSLSNAELDMQADLSRLHTLMLGILLADKPGNLELLRAKMQDMDDDLHKDLARIESEFHDNGDRISEINREMNDWQNIRMQMIDLVQHGQKDKAFKLATLKGARLYSRLQTDMDHAAASAQQQVKFLAKDAENSASSTMHMAWWFLGGLFLSGTLFGVAIIRKISVILERDSRATKRLYESGERLKLALSGADEGTWDLDVPSGKLNFDSQWGEMLGYATESDRPHYLEEWTALVHNADRERVRKAMHEHIEGWTAEYKVEYRIRSGFGSLKWVAGHGRAVRRGADGKAQRVVGITRDITQKKQAEEMVWQLAHSDSLTGLPNRVSFYDRLGQAIAYAKRHDKRLALLFLDLDGFKQVNDKCGHDVGDAVLQEVAERLHQNIRGEDTVARTGGDEFIFILNDIAGAEDVAIVASKIIHILGEPFQVNGNSCHIGGSIGISIFPDDTSEMEVLVSQADDAMYKAKANGKNNYQFFAPPDKQTQLGF